MITLRPLAQYDHCYLVGDDGSMISLKNGWHRLVPTLWGNGYYRFQFHHNGKKINKLCHRLIAEKFIPNPNNLPQCNHKNELKTDNRAENLEWCTASYNTNYGTRNKRVAEKLKGRKR